MSAQAGRKQIGHWHTSSNFEVNSPILQLSPWWLWCSVEHTLCSHSLPVVKWLVPRGPFCMYVDLEAVPIAWHGIESNQAGVWLDGGGESVPSHPRNIVCLQSLEWWEPILAWKPWPSQRAPLSVKSCGEPACVSVWGEAWGFSTLLA